MSLGVTFWGQIIFILAIVMAVVGYYLGQRKTQTPVLTAIVAFFSAFLPPIALVFLIALVLKNDIEPTI
ncbi:MAG: hypothetical protein HWE10_08510 [Gammaproteobacteria bacterium]|nr:hypothetical protein [Gammaproteobacteria bacterium]